MARDSKDISKSSFRTLSKVVLKMNQNQNVSEKNSIRPRNRCVLILIDGFWIAPEWS